MNKLINGLIINSVDLHQSGAITIYLVSDTRCLLSKEENYMVQPPIDKTISSTSINISFHPFATHSFVLHKC